MWDPKLNNQNKSMGRNLTFQKQGRKIKKTGI